MPPKPVEAGPKRCTVCRVRFHRGPGVRAARWAAQRTCGAPACRAAWGHRTRASYRQRQLHRCALDGCRAWVPRVDGEHEARYRRRRYCGAEHRAEARGTKRTRRLAPWRLERRTCARVGCGEVFAPRKAAQRFHDHACSVASRTRGKPRETKTCECGCGQGFERPAGLDAAAWARRRFVDAAHRARGGWLRPGEARTGKRREPRVHPKRRTRSATKTAGPASPMVTEPAPVFWRPPAPVVAERPARTRRVSLAAIRR